MAPSADQFDDVRRVIEHTLLDPLATEEDVRRVAEEAREHRLFALCVSPIRVSVAKAALDPSIRLVSVVGFPSGAHHAAIKAAEARRAMEEGAEELDMVAPLGAIRQASWPWLHDEVAAVVAAAGGALVKVIIETPLLTADEKVSAASVAVSAGASFVKTGTGASGAVTLEDVRLLRKAVGTQAGLKASGGIRSVRQARELIRAGADRLGTSKTLRLLGAS